MGGDAKMVNKLEENRKLNVIERGMQRLFGLQTQEAPLEFLVDMEEDKHIIEVYLLTPNGSTQLINPQDVWRYGSKITIGRKHYTITQSSLEILQAIGTRNPKVLPDGRLIIEMYLPILKYLRKKDNVEEKKASQRLKIYDSLPYGAEIDFDPENGMLVKTGYRNPESSTFIPSHELEPIGRRYLKQDDNYFCIPLEEDPEIKEWSDVAWKRIPLNAIPEFFKRDLVILRSKFNAVLTDQAATVKVIDSQPTSIINVTPGEPGWLDFNVEYKTGKWILPHHLIDDITNTHQQINENTWIRIDKEQVNNVQKELEHLRVNQTERGYRVNTHRFMSLEEFIKKIGGTKELSREYQHFLEQIQGFKYNPTYQLPQHIEKDLVNSGIKLRPYQRAGIHWLNWLTSHFLHGILADDMGLGKTIQTIAVMRLTYEEGGSMSHSLVISPKSVIRHWRREIKRVFPQISTYEYRGVHRNKQFLYSPRMRIFLTSYDMVTRDIEILKTIPFLFVILDEGTKIKNPHIKRTIAVKQLNAAHRISLSGTPIENRPAELWSIIDFLMKGHLGTYRNFISQFEKPILKGHIASSVELAKRIHPFTLRRLKEDVAKDLPEKIQMEEWCSLTDEQKELYSQIQNLGVKPIRKALQKGASINYTISIFPLITKLKQVCNHPALLTGMTESLLGRSEKFDRIIEKIVEFTERKENTVLFSHFLGTLDLFEKQLNHEGIKYIRIDGTTQNRQNLIDKFNKGRAAVALCSIIACCHGIDLTNANHIIHVDRWWNPAIEDQATDRVHRIGQTKTVYVHKILTMNTLEEKIAILLERKRKISDKIISTTTMGEMQWTRKELLKILEPYSP
jgi:SNF2 family DNA or RNA helicase